jgi:multiple sugar transport system permease protein
VAGLGIPFLDFAPTLDNFRTELSTPEGFRALRTSILVSVSATLLALGLGMPAAYALARFRFWSNADITVWFLSQRVLVPVATLIPFYLTFRTLGLLDTPLALILVNTTFVLPFVVVIMRQTFLDLPVELEEAALVDGATYFGCFLRIALPLAAPAAAATAMIIFAFTWNEFLFSSSLGITQTKMMPAHMAGAVDTRGVQFWFMATRALIAMVPPVLLALIAQRYIVRGLTLGAVKG